MSNETTNAEKSLPRVEGSAVSPAKYRVKRIVRTFADGHKEGKSVCVEVANLEAYRKRLKKDGCVDVSFVYESA